MLGNDAVYIQHTAFHTVVVNPTGVRSVPLCHHTGYCSLLMSSHLLLVNSNVIWLVIGPAARLQTSFRGALSSAVWWVAGLLPLLAWSLATLSRNLYMNCCHAAWLGFYLQFRFKIISLL